MIGIAWELQIVDSSHHKASRTEEDSGKSPVDREKNGSKSHSVTDANGIPLGVIITSGSIHDSREIGNLLKAKKYKDKGEFCLKEASRNNMKLEISVKNRYAIERTHDHLNLQLDMRNASRKSL